MQRVLVTGGAGFIGSHLADALISEGYTVIVFDNESTGFRKNVPKKARYMKGDVSDKEDIRNAFDGGLDAVFHVAGQASTINSFGNPLEDLTTNIIGTINIIELCLQKKVPRLLYASSMTCYGHPEKIPTPVDSPCRPISYYGITKYAAERYVHAAADRNDLNFQFQVTSFRMFNVYGERQSLENPYQGVMAIFISNILDNTPITIHSDGEQSRDFIYIKDVVDAWIMALNEPESYNKVINIGTSMQISINQLVDEILKANGKDRSGYTVEYGPERPGDQKHMQADISETMAILGWSPKVRFKEGMQRTVRWARQHYDANEKRITNGMPP